MNLDEDGVIYGAGIKSRLDEHALVMSPPPALKQRMQSIDIREQTPERRIKAIEEKTIDVLQNPLARSTKISPQGTYGGIDITPDKVTMLK